MVSIISPKEQKAALQQQTLSQIETGNRTQSSPPLPQPTNKIRSKIVFAGAALAATTLAAPAPASTATPLTKPFGLIATQSGSEIHNLALSAKGGSLWINHRTHATCDSALSDPAAAQATFFVTPESQSFFL